MRGCRVLGEGIGVGNIFEIRKWDTSEDVQKITDRVDPNLSA